MTTRVCIIGTVYIRDLVIRAARLEWVGVGSGAFIISVVVLSFEIRSVLLFTSMNEYQFI